VFEHGSDGITVLRFRPVGNLSILRSSDPSNWETSGLSARTMRAPLTVQIIDESPDQRVPLDLATATPLVAAR
jgi:hypothetical protein